MDNAAPKGPARFSTFLIIWLGQVLSTLGSALTGFALGVWVYQTTGSVTQFALIWFFTSLPGILASPIGGALVDRWNRRTALLAADTGAGLCTLGIALLIWTGRLEIWHIYVLMSISSVFNSLQWPAYSASISLLVPKEQYGRAAGLAEGGQGIAQILAPTLGAAILVAFGIHAVILFDFATALAAIGTLLLVRIPHHAPQGAERRGGKPSLWAEARQGWAFIRARTGLLALLLLLSLENFINSAVHALFIPLVLGFAGTVTLGAVWSVAACGLLAGTVAMAAWGGPKRKADGILVSLLVQGAMLVLGGLRPSLILVGASAFAFLFCVNIVNGCSQAIWLRKTPASMQGRVFATRRMIAWATLPLGYALAGPLSDRVFEPLMAVGGPLASSVGRIIGAGPGRGVALLYILFGIAMMLIALLWTLAGSIRRVEAELPDADEERVAAAS